MSFRSAADLNELDVVAWLRARAPRGCPKSRLDLEAELAFATDKSQESPDLSLESCLLIASKIDAAIQSGLVLEGPEKTLVAPILDREDQGSVLPTLPNARLKSVERHGVSFATRSFGSEFEPGGVFGPDSMGSGSAKEEEFVLSVKEHWRTRGFITPSQASVLASILHSSRGRRTDSDEERGSWRDVLKESVGRSDPRLIGLGAEEAAAAARSRREELETGWTAEEAFKWAEREATSIAAARREKAEEKKRERVFAKERSARRAMVDMWVKDAAGAKDAPLRPSPSGRADLDLSKALADLPGSGDIGRLRASEISAAMGTPAGMERYLAACAAVFDGHAEDPSGPTFDAAARGAENPRLMLVLSAALYGAPPDRVWGCSEIKEGSRWAERLRDIRAALEGLPPAPLSDKSVGKEHLRSATKLAAGFARIRRPETVSLHPLSAFVLAEKSLDGNLLSCALSMLGPESIRALSSALDGVGKGAVRPAPSKGGSVLD